MNIKREGERERMAKEIEWLALYISKREYAAC